MNASVKIRKIDSENYYRALQQTSLFSLVDDVCGAGGARLITIRPVEWLSQIDIIIEQPHVTAVSNFEESIGYEIRLRCETYEMIEMAYSSAQQSSLNITDLYDRPWGGQFAIFDNSRNIIVISN
ncbi:hypothetical protein [Rheinheimera faecalis]|uniref:hypothetical protein n=1 Tax=Rheinheimera faecalis TaxID=2901141 RepID=UPI001E614F7A|nr:hypothetical protein [Rheinheimera faecalis]